MGNKLENVKRNVETAESIEQNGLEQGEKDGSEVREIKSILEGMDKDVDEDILEAIGETREAEKIRESAYSDELPPEDILDNAEQRILEISHKAQRSRYTTPSRI